jgi:hypothetical protein
VSIVEHIVAESCAESILQGFAGSSVVLASSATKSISVVVAASTVTTASSASSAHVVRQKESL